MDGCDSVVTIIVEYESTTFTVLPIESVIQLGDIVELEVVPESGNILWTPSNFLSCDTCATVLATPEYSIYYTVSKEDESGCITNQVVFIEVIEPEIFIPSAFSPNGDQINDVLYILDENINTLTYFRIYNRWGELLFMTSNLNEGWNGFWNGTLQEMDTYIYDIELINSQDLMIQLSGSVLLIN